MTIPDEAVSAAALAINNELGQKFSPGGWRLRQIAEAALEAAAPLIAAAERRRIYAELGNDHYVIYTEDRWTIEHSVQCRLSGEMHKCVYHGAVADVSEEYEPAMAGRWRIVSIDTEGLPVLERADLPGGAR